MIRTFLFVSLLNAGQNVKNKTLPDMQTAMMTRIH